jgi:3-hydroxymyristoyl/3-hydroxydecanoyl-(acyl carrier protein) dehydratase
MSATSRRLFPIAALRREVLDDHELVAMTVEVPADLLYFQGHFPGFPILPGVAQLVPLVLAQIREAWPELDQPERLSRLKFRQPVFPGATLELRLERRGAQVRFRLMGGARASSEGSIEYPAPPA